MQGMERLEEYIGRYKKGSEKKRLGIFFFIYPIFCYRTILHGEGPKQVYQPKDSVCIESTKEEKQAVLLFCFSDKRQFFVFFRHSGCCLL
jgi:hypothetical protein